MTMFQTGARPDMLDGDALFPPASLGVIGSGQLGRMFIQAAQRMGYRAGVLSATEETPAAQVANWTVIGPRAHNQLLRPASQLSPYIEQILTYLAEENCPVVGMSGSGTTCFAVCRCAPHARQVAARLRIAEGGATWVQSTRTL